MKKLSILLIITFISSVCYAAPAIRIVDSDGDELSITSDGKVQLSYIPDYDGPNNIILVRKEDMLKNIKKFIKQRGGDEIQDSVFDSILDSNNK